MAVHLTRIYTNTGDDGTTALGDMSRVRKTDPRVGAYADCDETNAAIGVALALGDLPERVVGGAADRSRTTCSTSAPTCARRSSRSPHTRRCGSSRPTSSGSRAGATSSTPTCPSWPASSCPAARPAPRCCTRPARWPGGPSAAPGRSYEADAEHTNRDALLYLNRLSDLLFILSRVANPGGDVLWKPGGER